jgi:hypothetical protein
LQQAVQIPNCRLNGLVAFAQPAARPVRTALIYHVFGNLAQLLLSWSAEDFAKE